MTQGKIERYYRSLNNLITMRNYCAPGELDQEIGRFVAHYNNERVHESIKNLTPADVYYGRAREILTERERLMRQTLASRKRYNLGKVVKKEELIRPALFREVPLNPEPTESRCT